MADSPDTIPNEIWKPVGSVPNVEASSLGRIRAYIRPGGGSVVRLAIINGDATGSYRKIKLGSARYYVHRLVCEAFHGAPFDGATVDHIDGNRGNNTPHNLEWVTRAENTRRQNRDGRGVAKGGKHPLAKLSDAQSASIKSLKDAGQKPRQIAEQFGVSPALIYKILSGHRRTHCQPPPIKAA